ncbi:MAG: TraR/DksA family transcriptional regulator [Planctomycetaceae bacterium]
MARKDALLRLHERLVAKRDSLRKKFSSDDLNLSQSQSWEGAGDVGDAAHGGSQSELNSQLASLESRELAQIEQAIQSIREGTYGTCEMCGCAIPIARLKVLPYTPYCVSCQRKRAEMQSSENGYNADWETAFEHEGRLNDQELSIGDLDIDG